MQKALTNKTLINFTKLKLRMLIHQKTPSEITKARLYIGFYANTCNSVCTLLRDRPVKNVTCLFEDSKIHESDSTRLQAQFPWGNKSGNFHKAFTDTKQRNMFHCLK
jgi:hypothetical protein